MAPPKAKTGRPSKNTDTLTEEICGRLASGEPMSKITRDAHMPDMSTVYKWLRKDNEFRQMYEVARQDGAHTYASEISEIVDTEPNKVYDEAGNMKYDPASIAHSRLRMDARKWLAAKYLPKVYGERQVIAGDADNPIKIDAEVQAQELLDALLKNVELKKQAGDD